MRKQLHAAVGLAWLTAMLASPARAQPFAEWTLYAPTSGSPGVTLVDLDGQIVQTWPSDHNPGLSVYLLDGGSVLYAAADFQVVEFGGAGTGGRIQRIGWDGTLEWNYVPGDLQHTPHHDIEPLPNGNVLIILWERHTTAEAIAQGRNPANAGAGVWSETIYEVEPQGATGGKIVWSWRVWDHLVQDFDPALPNFGNPADHPGRIDINFPTGSSTPDWLHFNAIDYNAELDQIVVSCRSFHELWVFSHDPEDDGDLLYRWGNPAAYGRGTIADRQLEGQHDTEWIPEGHPGAGNIILYNNGTTRGFSSLDEITPPLLPDGTYELEDGEPFGPASTTWTCDEMNGKPFYSPIMSSVQRLPNGNTLGCVSTLPTFFETDDSCTTVWQLDLFNPLVFRATRIGAFDSRVEGLLWAAADTNGDLRVNVQDLVNVIAQWGTSGPEADVAPVPAGDGIVDVLDLTAVVLQWD